MTGYRHMLPVLALLVSFGDHSGLGLLSQTYVAIEEPYYALEAEGHGFATPQASMISKRSSNVLRCRRTYGR